MTLGTHHELNIDVFGIDFSNGSIHLTRPLCGSHVIHTGSPLIM